MKRKLVVDRGADLVKWRSDRLERGGCEREDTLRVRDEGGLQQRQTDVPNQDAAILRAGGV